MKIRCIILPLVIVAALVAAMLVTMTATGGDGLDFQLIERVSKRSSSILRPPTNRFTRRLLQSRCPSLPLKNLTYPMKVLVETEWFISLQTFLSRSSKNEIVLLSSDRDFLPVLLNWLAAFRANTNSTLEEVLILAMDSDVHKSLLDRGFNSIHIRDKDIFLPNIRLVTPYSHIWMKRSTVARITNYYGYDVMMFDLDAVVLKDITKFLDGIGPADIVGSKGKYPFHLGQQWGFTLCMGVVLFRSTEGTEMFWDAVSKLSNKFEDDQVRTNKAFEILNISWTTDSSCDNNDFCTTYGRTPLNLTVTLLSHDVVCRSCNQRMAHNYYVWHKRSSRNGSAKEKKARKGNAWYLKDNWRELWENSAKKSNDLVDEIRQ